MVELEWSDAAVGEDRQPMRAPVPPSAALNGASGATVVTGSDPASPADNGSFWVHAPTVGTFYWAPEPGARPFVANGDVVQPGQQVGILEAMKMMLPVTADRAGQVAEFLVKDGTPVEFDTPLITLIEV